MNVIITGIPRLTRFEWQPKNRVSRNAEILYYKIALCKFFWTPSKNRVVQIRVMENRVSRGIPIPTYYAKIINYLK